MIKYWLLVLLIHASSSQSKPPTSNKVWKTLKGDPPVVVARGGYSGVFPESSPFAHELVKTSSVTDTVILCNLQLTKDGAGICQPDVKIDNSTNVNMVYPKQQKTYKVNGKEVTGWFSIDFTSDQLYENVTVMQNILTRPSAFDNLVPIAVVEDVLHTKFDAYWLNVQYSMFYDEHKLNMASYIQKQKLLRSVAYLSSPEIGLLKALAGKVSKRTKLVFAFLDQNLVEPSTNQKYGDILKDLAAIKLFASGILVPKNYIWPTTKANYLEKAPTSLVTDAHEAGLLVYVTGFANDMVIYDYHYDPVVEYLNFIDHPQFSVDGLISDFPTAASSAVACFGEFSNFEVSKKGRTTIISHNGASGIYPGSTDLAYQQALKDGADIIDCSVQMSKDGISFCLDSADLTGDTTAMPTFVSRSSTIPEIQKDPGVFTFDLTWAEIQTLKPQLTSPLGDNNLFPRNPASKNAGKFVTLVEFLEVAKVKGASGILINIENAAYLASKKGLDIVTAVSKALINATFDKQSTQQVLIQSDDTSVLSKFQNVPAYKRVLYLKDEISDAPAKPVDEIRKYADAVTLPRFSIIPTTDDGFGETPTKVVEEMHKANLTVYVSVLRNEYGAIPFDFFADPTVELSTYTSGLAVDGIITEYPGTASRYLNNVCGGEYELSYTILPIEPPLLLGFLSPDMQPPATAPMPVLDVDDVVDPPLPAVIKSTDQSGGTPPPAATQPKSSSNPNHLSSNFSHLGLTLMATLMLDLLFR
ncbi:glycerophosphodiester phosphodiesterase GDPDL6-like [Euphorbia lathyris]|uniref:glycerophosphodiester phosphodiesterase GDPDL6-like n=1 Tax=Euphorbia lathyris TaxID=212925 RepID=UPI0033130C34